MFDFNLKDQLNATEIYTIAILLVYSFLAVIFFPLIPRATELLFQNITILILIISISTLSSKLDPGKPFIAIRKFYLIPFIYIIYGQVQHYISVVNPNEYDLMFIKWDYAIFGVNPTEWLYQYSNPILTEYLQFCYMMFFFMPIAQGIELHYSRQNDRFNQFARLILLGFYVSYLLYFIFPAIGPRFHLHNFATLYEEMPGILFADTFRNLINSGGGIPIGAANPAELVNRDCMPSGHTMLTLINIWLGFRNRSRLRYVFLIIGLSLVFSTVYLRYHYVVDVFAGALFAAIVLVVEPKLYKFLRKYFKSA